jgi:hypothetical protein
MPSSSHIQELVESTCGSNRRFRKHLGSATDANNNFLCNNCAESFDKYIANPNSGISIQNPINITIRSEISLNTAGPASAKMPASNLQTGPTESYIKGCINCAQFLPQCTLCMRHMKINLTPSPITMNLNSSTSAASSIKPKPKSPSSAGGTNVNPIAMMSASKKDQLKYQQQQQNLSKSFVLSENLYFLNNSKFGNWFSWCQSCKHGGHIKHLADWFKSHDKCPFMHCQCRCANIEHSH